MTRELLSVDFLLEDFDALFVWCPGELATPKTVVSNVCWPFRAVHVLNLNFPP